MFNADMMSFVKRRKALNHSSVSRIQLEQQPVQYSKEHLNSADNQKPQPQQQAQPKEVPKSSDYDRPVLCEKN
jgi:hypothetical protein